MKCGIIQYSTSFIFQQLDKSASALQMLRGYFNSIIIITHLYCAKIYKQICSNALLIIAYLVLIVHYESSFKNKP